MFRCIVLIFALAGLYHVQLVESQVIQSKPTKNSLNTITSLISGTYPLFEYLKLYVDDLPIWQNLTDKELKSISVERYLKSGNWFREMRHNVTFDYQFQQLILIISKIESMFDGYVQFKENFSRYNRKNQFSNASYRAYVQDVFRIGSNEIAKSLNEITMIITQPNSEVSDSSLINAFIINTLETENVCQTKLSDMQKIGQLLGYFTIIELKGLLTILFGYDIKEWLLQDDFSSRRYTEQKKSLTRYKSLLNSFQSTLSQTSNELHGCSPDQHVDRITYFELEGLFQTYIIQEINAAPWFLCGGKCLKTTGIQNQNQCRNGPQPVPKELKEMCMTPRCEGRVQGCKPLRKDESHKYPKVCISGETNTTRRYDFVTYDNNDKRKCNKELTQLSDLTVHLKKIVLPCIYCQCTCERDDRKKRKYRFSLQPSLVDYDKDYVVTGARLMLTDDGLIYIQIQQGQLLPHGGIVLGSNQWLIPSLKNAPVQEITWNFRRVNLDSLNVPDGHVIVGVKLNKKATGSSNYFELQAMHLPYNAISGSLIKDVKPQIIIADNTKESIYRRELRLNNKDVPTRFHSKEYRFPGNHYLRFQPTDLTKDGGQSTIPFIDIQNVNFKIPTPLSGIGLSYRGNTQSGGFLDLILFSYKFTHDLLKKNMTHEVFVDHIK